MGSSELFVLFMPERDAAGSTIQRRCQYRLRQRTS
jgi:hypothetical protein